MLDRATGATELGTFPDILSHLLPGDALVLNETRVLKARVFATRQETGGRVELLFVRPGAAGTHSPPRDRPTLDDALASKSL